MNTYLNLQDIASLSPFLIVLIATLLVLVVESISTQFAKSYTAIISLFALALAFIASLSAPSSANALLTPWLRFDGLARLFNLFFISISMGSTLLGEAFFQRNTQSRGEYYFLLLSSLFGLMLIGSSNDFLTLFLGLETLSISLYILCNYVKKWTFSSEASLKYFLMGSIASAILLYGIAMIYGAVGSTNFAPLASTYSSIASTQQKSLFFAGIALVTAGFAFKAAIVPFHLWAPDVYDGSPTPVTAFMAVGTKVGAFAAFIILFLLFLPSFDPLWSRGMELLSYITMIYANFVAIRQVQLRRFFAYSGIAHAGYLLIPLVAGTPQAIEAMLFYLAIYALATMGSFAVLAFLDQRPEGVVMKDLYGLYQRSPLLASILTLCLVTLTGLPPTAGFFAKFFIFKVGFQAGYYGLVVVGLLMTILSAYYYLRIAAIMFSRDPTEEEPLLSSWPAGVVAVTCSLAILVLSIYPGIIRLS